jgi:nitrate reductase delta subunit
MLLAYPDEWLLDRLDLMRAVVAGLPAPARAALGLVVDHLATTPLAEQQRDYVATFDLRKKCCLYLSWWVHGDTRNRGQALVAFKTAYREAGTQPPTTELPDHLAVVLEFAATVDGDQGEALLVEHRPALELIRAALHKAGAPQAGVLDAVCASLPGPVHDAVTAARRLAASGPPPTELVGLEGYR